MPLHPPSKRLAQSLFVLTAYSLTGAALMGSSIGLVVYQSRQFFFLNRLSRHDLTSHPPSDPLFNTSVPDPGAHLHHNHHGHEHGHGHRHHRRIKYLIFSTWLPVLVWVLTLITTIVLVTRRKWVPKIMSAKSGILMSLAIFSLFWVLLGSIQEVQEKLIVQRTALARGEINILQGPTHGLTGEGGLPIDIPYLARSKIRAMLVPLCLVWYLAVVLLGIATGMLASSSSIMERRLADAYYEAVDKEDEQYTESTGLFEEEKESTEDVHGTQLLATMIKTTSDEYERPLPRYTSKERIALGALILSLFVSQMRLFQWIVHNQTMAAYITGSSVSVSSCVTMVGLVSGLVLIVLGVRSLPAL
ncbi:hypothetical protein BGZ93_010222 [Podila epicladia]|nr:hypothetical protein BGZ92_008216 [Podila epicladia]KAG0098840.1 hypothetical protein BGZ93_010222 [Podila epicladia]